MTRYATTVAAWSLHQEHASKVPWDVTVILPDGAVYDGLVDLRTKKVQKWEKLDGLQPIVSYTLDILDSPR